MQKSFARDTDYEGLFARARALTEGVPYWVTNLANLSALLYEELDGINWAGFYLTRDGALALGPFQGKPACIRIPWGKGVCGAAAKANETLVVADVHAFSGHIACDSASRSEIVVPLRRSGAVAGVLDIDSPFPDRFDERDRAGLERLAALAEKLLCENTV